MGLTIAKDRVVHIYYVLKGDDQEVLDASGEDPLAYLHGHENIVVGLEKHLEGKAAGEEIDVVVPAAEGYGEVKPDAYETVHRRDLPRDTKLEVGSPIVAQSSAGKQVALWITKVHGARVTITTNHPLAGKNLHFHVLIAAVREGGAEEIAHGHVHEPGHSH